MFRLYPPDIIHMMNKSQFLATLVIHSNTVAASQKEAWEQG